MLFLSRRLIHRLYLLSPRQSALGGALSSASNVDTEVINSHQGHLGNRLASRKYSGC